MTRPSGPNWRTLPNGDIIYRRTKRSATVDISQSELERVVGLRGAEWVFTLASLLLPLSLTALWWVGRLSWIWPAVSVVLWMVVCQLVHVRVSKMIEFALASAKPSEADFVFQELSLKGVSGLLAGRLSLRLLRFCAVMSLVYLAASIFMLMDGIADLGFHESRTTALIVGIWGAILFGLLTCIFVMASREKNLGSIV